MIFLVLLAFIACALSYWLGWYLRGCWVRHAPAGEPLKSVGALNFEYERVRELTQRLEQITNPSTVPTLTEWQRKQYEGMQNVRNNPPGTIPVVEPLPSRAEIRKPQRKK